MKKPILIIHGGAGSGVPKGERRDQIHCALDEILEESYRVLKKTKSAEKAVVRANQMLEDCPLFNAGKGSAIQADGVARLSASVMDGQKLKFAGVINIKGLKNPILLAQKLLKAKNSVLSDEGAKKFALKEKLKLGYSYTARSRQRLKDEMKSYDTTGAVALDAYGRIAAATSTGGMVATLPGRVSDSATVAGNYANEFAGVSTTGIGEEIVEHAVAAKVVTRVTDGMSLKQAFAKTLREARKKKAEFGLIAIDKKGNWAAETTTEFMSWGIIGPEKKVVP